MLPFGSDSCRPPGYACRFPVNHAVHFADSKAFHITGGGNRFLGCCELAAALAMACLLAWQLQRPCELAALVQGVSQECVGVFAGAGVGAWGSLVAFVSAAGTRDASTVIGCHDCGHHCGAAVQTSTAVVQCLLAPV